MSHSCCLMQSRCKWTSVGLRQALHMDITERRTAQSLQRPAITLTGRLSADCRRDSWLTRRPPCSTASNSSKLDAPPRSISA